MKLHSSTPYNFKGYDARPLQGFYMVADCCGIAKEMKAVGDKEGFKIYSTKKDGSDSFNCSETLPHYTQSTSCIWAQDMWMIVKNKLLSYDDNVFADSIKNFFKLKDDFTQSIIVECLKTAEEDEILDEGTQEEYHIAGGNVFIVKGDNGDELLVGQDSADNFSINELKSMYNVDKVTVLPQMDYHLDLFIRPLDNKRVLLVDDTKTLEFLQNGINKIFDYMKKHPDEREECFNVIDRFINLKAAFENDIADNENAKQNMVEKILNKNGFEVIKVPGRFYNTRNSKDDSNLDHYCNYINANVLKNKDGEIVYITNKSDVDKRLGLTPEMSEKIGFSFEKSFVDSISPYVNPEHIYFIEGENNFVSNSMLTGYQGGIHCVCMEVPK